MTEFRPRRSVLFMPSSNERALEKAKTLPADTLVFDLEDAVAPNAKGAARELAVQALRSGEYGAKELVVRINAIDTDWWRDDVAALAGADAKTILIPKVDSSDVLAQVYDAFTAAGGSADVVLWAMIETAMGVVRVANIAAGHKNLSTLAFGANDLSKELHARRVAGRAPLLTALSNMLLAGRAYGLTVLDSVYNDFRDAEGFEAECQQARDMGFDGKTLIHPNQLEVANRVFAPSADEIVEAEQLISAFNEAANSGKGVAVLDGKMIEELHVQEAKRILAMAKAANSMDEGN